MKVANRKCIRRLSIKSMRSARSRNIIAIIAIALTAVLFTTLFTIVASIAYGFEQSNFRRIGGYAHGSFKYLTDEQVEELKGDSAIKEYGLRRFLGIASGELFEKNYTELSWCDDNSVKWMYLDTMDGRMPQENTDEAAVDKSILELLGVKPEIGSAITIPIEVDGVETTESFTLSGWWEHDEVNPACHILVPESRVDEIFEKLGTKGNNQIATTTNMDVMLGNTADIGGTLLDILTRHGYQNDDSSKPAYIAIGVNWGYLTAQLSDGLDAGMVASVAAIMLIIIFTGYLIIYNVFQISVSNDIRFYGLLKTIGTTGRQIRRMVFIQAVALSAIGIPIGLLLGYAVGALLTPVILMRLNDISADSLSVNPWIFIGSAIFALCTVLISCMKPSKAAAKVSPVEALRYTEGSSLKKSVKKSKKGASVPAMAFANLVRSRSKTVVTVLSMSLSVLLLSITFTFTSGFDMNKYLKDIKSDFVVADTSYYNTRGGDVWGQDAALPENIIDIVNSQGNIAASGRTYGLCSIADEYREEEYYRNKWRSYGNTEETLDYLVDSKEHTDARLEDGVQLYGMEEFCLDKLTVLEGDITKLYGDGNYIAAVYRSDDYGNPLPDSAWAKLGEKIKIKYVRDYEYYNPDTGEAYDGEIPNDMPCDIRVLDYDYVEYEVAALVDMPNKMSYRYYSNDEFVLGDDVFKRDTQTENVMYYAFDMADGEDCSEMDSFLKDFTENAMPQYAYESKQTYTDEFDSFKNMFILMGSALCIIVGIIGVLNFLNAVLTGIIARRRELAMLQSVGMTGTQLKRMLVCEGMYYAGGTVLLSLMLGLLIMPVAAAVLENLFWFFSYSFTVVPTLAVIPFFAALGIIIPLVSYHFAAKKSIVERLREAE